MNPKKLLFVHHGIGIGGASTSLLQMLLRLRQDSAFKLVVIFMEDSDARCWYQEHGILVAEVMHISPFSHTVIWWYPWFRIHHFFFALWGVAKTFYKAYWLLKKYNPDIVHLNSTPAWPWALVAKWYGMHVACHVREPLAAGYLGIRRQFLVWYLQKFADVILAISKFDGSLFAQSGKLTILYNAVDSERFSLKKLQKNGLVWQHPPTVFLYVGGASKEKGAYFLLKVWEAFLKKRPHAKLLIAGNWDLAAKPGGLVGWAVSKLGIKTPQQRFFAKLACWEKLADSVEILGLQKNIEIAMAKADVLLFPCQVGHFARPILEAAFLQKPSIAANLPPLDELVVNGETGFLLPAFDLASWVETMLLFSNDLALRKKLGRQAYVFAKQHFSLSKQIVNLKNIYQSFTIPTSK